MANSLIYQSLLPPGAPLLPDLPTDQLRLIVNSALQTVSRQSTSALFGLSHDGGRDVKTVFGWPDDGDRSFDFYFSLYRYQDYAKRVCDAMPRACWRSGAKLADSTGQPILVDELSKLSKRNLFSALERADILNRIGSYSVLYIGLQDGDPAAPVSNAGGDITRVYFAPYSEPAAQILEWDMDPSSDRYGLPTYYALFPTTSTRLTQLATDVRQSLRVHWSRIVHLAEGALDSPVFGVSCLEAGANRLVDLQKTLGGSAESFYRIAKPNMVLDIDKETLVRDSDLADLETAAKDWLNEWKSFIGISGGQIRTLSQSSYPSVSEAVDVQIKALAALYGMPLRVLTGEGGGQYAGNEDRLAWNQLVADRQKIQCSQWFFGVLDILSEAGFFEIPETASVIWPLTEELSERAKAEVDLIRAQTVETAARAISTWATTPGSDSVIDAEEFKNKLWFDND